ncbi:hypothetical protein DEU38_103185 [Rhodococcus sp. AG1013]|uniref:hypothetical protein n=1 Tax=Rhodococcus sp. AG1013 TaxID=2183996 RepID=UPI000E0A1E79|nr:hypothetical protein [Rhodococcus sp. AG1013]RDI32452.1 hypothetical protein DEU38_103185 [Rhodococcus sp. AG1013]
MPTIIPTSTEQSAEIARRLLDAADSADQVQTVTSGNTTAFSVPDDVAERAGFGDREPVAPPSTEPQEPPRSGKGSSEAAWQAFLAAQGIEFPEDAERGALIALWDAHKDA